MKHFFTCLLLAVSIFCGSVFAQESTRVQNRIIAKKGTVRLDESEEPPVNKHVVTEMPRQGPGHDLPQKKSMVIPLKGEVDFGKITTDFAPSLLVKEMPKPGGSKMVTYPESAPFANGRTSKVNINLPEPIIGESLLANPFSGNTPNDNDVAISDSGVVVSVINTNIFVRDIVAKQNSPGMSLSAFKQTINNHYRVFDPKVLYDPNTDRFVLVMIVGSVDTTSNIIVGFSQNATPPLVWNLYELPGDALENGLWSDYPMIAITEKELFLTVNLLYNDSSWQTGFAETIVWQMSKDSGYAGKNLNSVIHSNIKWQGKPIRNLCPVKGGSKLYGPDMYFISNRNFASQNDTVFVVNISDVIGSPTSSLSVKAARTNLPYRFPPDGIQKETNQTLATNDARNLGAFIENGIIQYVHNTKNPSNDRATVYYGVIYYPETPQPVITGFMVENGSFDYAYPNISYAGLDSADNTAIITFNHSSADVFPGCSAVQADNWGNFSPVLKIRDGISHVNIITSALERWGDYSGSQRRYSKPGEVWMSGYYAAPHGTGYPKAHAAWVAQITTEHALYLNVKETAHQKTESVNVFPNPAEKIFSVDVKINRPEYLSFELFDARGAKVATLMRDWVKATDNVFSFNTDDLAPGIYFLKIEGNGGTNMNRKIVIR